MSEVLDNLIHLLKLEQLDDALFRGGCQDLGFRQVFGGQVVAQALSAAMQVAPKDRLLHSCHAYFLAPGDSQRPIIYDVETLREGRNFTALRVKAIQYGHPICHVTASFQVEESGFEHQVKMPEIGSPEEFMSESDALKKAAQYIPESVRDKFTAKRPFDIRAKYINNPFLGTELPPEQYIWVRANGKSPLDQNIQKCLLAYFSDFHCILTALHPHAKGFLQKGMKVATIDHSIWFHRSFDLNDWLLYAIESNNAFAARGLARGQIFDKAGRLIATTQQEGLIRYVE
ncbi:acyl-CoA thioesterase II [Basfia succiniciproducens]|uniref:Acyl-CoA thioesterase-2 n=1 Tax=Basfia succiniciproducens TaxID=653940 RepID=A0A1G5BQT9_9PAST|nr:acyl-CoA thioesterase II [Basfia succiniciproducens]QIM68338.1 acyl-CoA thioesterase II [Basfia succiniciproducens]SCX92447.1 acyl-CoA thioesterase-2 [Basfia succiniciproducens]